jgi:hypothetical protein
MGFKHYLFTALFVAVVIAIVFRVDALKKIVVGA